MPGHWGRSRSSSRGSAAPAGGPHGGGGQQQVTTAVAPPSILSKPPSLPPQLGGSGTAAQAAAILATQPSQALPPQLGGPSTAAQAAEFANISLGGERGEETEKRRLKALADELERERLEQEPDVRELSFRETREQNQIKRNKVLALRKLGLMQGWNPLDPIPAWAENLTEEELNEIARTGPYLGSDDARTAKQLESGSELLGRVFEGGPFNTGNMNQGGGGGGQGITSQYPYYPQDVHPGTDPTIDPTTDPTIPVDPIRFASNVPSEHDFSSQYFYGADGGDVRQNYGLGKLVKKATKAIGKIAKSPLGKAALMYGLGNIPFGKSKAGLFSRMFKGVPGVSNPGGDSMWSKMLGSMSSKPFPWIAGASALAGAYTAMNPEEEEDGYDYKKLDEWRKYHAGVGDPSNWQSIRGLADGGRIGYAGGKDHRAAALSAMYGEDEDENNMYKFAFGGSAGMPPVSIAPEGFNSQSFPDDESTGIAQVTPQNPMPMPMRQPMDPRMMDPRMMQMAQQQGNRRMAAEGGLMDMGGMEKDYRAEGGFVPLGGEERADDVPARLSKNEFVFTADAVRSAGSGDIDKGAEVMENLMENLEQGGQVSQGSQGLEGARDMFQTQQRLGEVL